jgi:hypothetical protein
MLEVFDIGIKILLILTSIFFLVFFYLCSLWSRPAHPEKRFIIGIMLSGIYTFIFFLAGFVILNLFSVIWENRESLLNLIEPLSL